MISERMRKQLDFILEIDKLKEITRQTYLADASRKENDTEHSWHLAMMCLLMNEHSNEEIDVLRTMAMVLIHDIVEIDAGDTYAYDETGKATQREREVLAAKRVFGILPEDQAQYMLELWEEFEAWETPEAKFAHTLDNVQPLLLNDASGGKSWREHGVRKEQPIARNKRTGEGSTQMYEHVLELIDKHANIGNLKN